MLCADLVLNVAAACLCTSPLRCIRHDRTTLDTAIMCRLRVVI